MKKISVIFGTRPEAIKLAPLISAIKKEKTLACSVCVTAQHRKLLDQILETFNLIPDKDLNLMVKDQSLSHLTSSALKALDLYLKEEKPDLVLIQGDTTTVFSAAVAAFYNNIPIGHIEAGLRTGNLNSPWPEEMNRVLTAKLATLHFAPTETNRQNLIREGISAEFIYVTGNTVVDSLMHIIRRVRKNPPKILGLERELLSGPNKPPIVLITSHRRESFGRGLESICRAVVHLGNRFRNILFIYPVHLNPNVREPVDRILKAKGSDNIILIEPLPYPSFVFLMYKSMLILTDSGGIQEEAPSLGKTVFVMREITERTESVERGFSRLVGNDYNGIVNEVTNYLIKHASMPPRIANPNPYGDGHASIRIVQVCKEFLGRL